MKKYASVWMLAARGTIYKVMGVFLLLAAGQIGVFHLRFNAELSARQEELAGQLLHPEYGVWEVPYPTLEDVLESGYINITLVWKIALVLLLVVLATNGTSLKNGSKSRYTLQRLSLGERVVAAHFAAYNFAVLVLFWAFSVGMALALCHLYYRWAQPNAFGVQSTFLAFYRNKLFHSLLPLAETTRYVRNVFMFAALALVATLWNFWDHQGKKGAGNGIAALWCVMGFTLVGFDVKTGEGFLDGLLICLSIVLCAWCAYYILCLGTQEAKEAKEMQEAEAV